METKPRDDAESTGKRRAVIYLDRGLFRRVRDEQASRDIPVSRVVEEILARHYGQAIEPAR